MNVFCFFFPGLVGELGGSKIPSPPNMVISWIDEMCQSKSMGPDSVIPQPINPRLVWSMDASTYGSGIHGQMKSHESIESKLDSAWGGRGASTVFDMQSHGVSL